MEVLNRQLDPERLLVGDCWGAADCAVQAHLSSLTLFFFQSLSSALSGDSGCVERTHLRPAFRLVMGFA